MVELNSCCWPGLVLPDLPAAALVSGELRRLAAAGRWCCLLPDGGLALAALPGGGWRGGDEKNGATMPGAGASLLQIAWCGWLA